MKSLKNYISILKSVKNRPTKFFIYLVIIILTLFLQAYMHNYNIVYLMIFFLVGVASASSIFGVLNLYNIKVKLLSYDRFFANLNAKYKLSIVNEAHNKAYDINIKSAKEVKYIHSIEPHNSAIISFKHKFLKRGEADLPEIKIYSFFPLPHELKYKFIHLQKKIIVYAEPKGVSLFKIYNKNSSPIGEIDEFEGLKNFNQGENISYIHWPSLAKNDSLKSKNFIYEDESKKLHFDFKSMKGSDEEKLSQLTLWVLECEKHVFKFTIDLNGKILDSKEMSINEILQTISKY